MRNRTLPGVKTGSNVPKQKTARNAHATDLLTIPHPGETLREDFMEPLGLSAYAVAKAIGTTPITISMILRGKRAVSPEMALRLARYTSTSAEFWSNLQSNYDLRVARRAKESDIHKRVIPLARAA